MIRHPLRRPAPPSPEMTLPAIKMLEELAVAQTMEPTSKIVMHQAKTHWISCQFHASYWVVDFARSIVYLVAKTQVELSSHGLQNSTFAEITYLHSNQSGSLRRQKAGHTYVASV